MKYLKIKDRTLELFLNKAKSTFENHLKKILLFGSRARGDYDKESDYDFILIFDKVTPEIEEKLEELTVEMLLEYGMVISDFAFTEGDLERKKYEPFIMNAKKEGVML